MKKVLTKYNIGRNQYLSLGYEIDSNNAPEGAVINTCNKCNGTGWVRIGKVASRCQENSHYSKISVRDERTMDSKGKPLV